METHTKRMACDVALPIRTNEPIALRLGRRVLRRLSRDLLTGGALLTLLAPTLFPHTAVAVQAIPVGDTYVHSSFPKPLGKKGQLRINARSTSYFQFDVTTDLPENTTADQIEKATLKFFLRKVPRGGALHLATVEAPWNESNLKVSNAPTLSGPLPNATVQIDATDASQFIVIDVTDQVKAWITNPTSNHGLALVASDGKLAIALDSKESRSTSHPPSLDIQLVRTGGPAGEKGEKGDKGEPGADGLPGLKGDTGDVGPMGPTGPQGLKGDTGEAGLQGVKGDKGDTGNVGPQGPQGLKGDTGEMGPQGLQGLKGDKGDTGDVGPQGLQGLKGDTGEMGPQGLQGLKGDKGDTGDVGPQGPQGLKGDTGEMGPQGLQGLKGDKGDTGDVGPQGPQGPKGDTGDIGPQGIQGEIGPVGPQGPKGDTGEPGPQGPAGTSAVGVAANAIVVTPELMNVSASNQATYGNLATLGPIVSVSTTSPGARALVLVTSEMSTSNDALIGRMSFEIMGPDGIVTILPADDRSLSGSLQTGPTNRFRATAASLVTLGAAGNYTITAKYRVQHTTVAGFESVTFSNREVIVTLF